ncbi:MAG: addiction module toxin RelE [Candidatus Woesearchaeota archaeon]|jgi:YafQ family addiction module toxin component|nr:addiction module toxin RelE [Candidatus Woesearchaeota archaeon]|tara:strand:+ start:29 stop:304 length:276 start_codon:yes stop_codon:yes gene_type:complete
MREFEIKPKLRKILDKLHKKDRKTYNAVMQKIEEVLRSEGIEHYKNLRHDLKQFSRVHIGSFVLVFSYNKQSDFVIFIDYDHHDNIYKTGS